MYSEWFILIWKIYLKSHFMVLFPLKLFGPVSPSTLLIFHYGSIRYKNSVLIFLQLLIWVYTFLTFLTFWALLLKLMDQMALDLFRPRDIKDVSV